MASTDLISALPVPAHPMAKSGFGKRTAGADSDESDARRPDTLTDFEHLPPREAYLAAYIDRLPEGAAIDVKTLAKVQPLYGQQAVRSALRELSRVGHLRRIGGLSGGETVQHVRRTYFSRTARGEGWWDEFLGVQTSAKRINSRPQTEDSPYEVSAAGREPAPELRPAPRTERGRPSARPRARRSEAYESLAVLGQRDPRLVLSAAECAELEPLAAQWHERGVCGTQFAYAMTSGLPSAVHSPASLLRRRLADKLPPEPAAGPPEPEPEVRHWRLECTECGVPGDPVALPGGLCRRCRDEPEPQQEPERTGLSGEEVRNWTAALRAAGQGRPRRSTTAARTRERERT